MYLIATDSIADLSTLKFARYLEQNNELWVTHSKDEKWGNIPLNSSQLKSAYEWASTRSVMPENEKPVADISIQETAIQDIAIEGIAIEEGISTANDNVIVLAATGLNFRIIEQVLRELPIQSKTISIKANVYHHCFDKTVINIACNINSTDALRTKIKVLCEQLFIDIFVQPKVNLQQPGLAVFDMDSTLIEMECIDEIAKLAGVGEEVSAVTEQAMQGEIAFSESLHHRVACLKGVELKALLAIRERLPFMPGLSPLLTELKLKGWKVLVASGGFTFFADYIKALFDLDHAFSNTLEVSNGKLTGKVVGDVVDAQAKADILSKIALQLNIPISNTIAVGDGANDLVMMSVAGAGIAFKAKSKVQAQADNSIRFSGLEAVLYLLG